MGNKPHRRSEQLLLADEDLMTQVGGGDTVEVDPTGQAAPMKQVGTSSKTKKETGDKGECNG
jgi:hypothetical protein